MSEYRLEVVAADHKLVGLVDGKELFVISDFATSYPTPEAAKRAAAFMVSAIAVTLEKAEEQ